MPHVGTGSFRQSDAQHTYTSCATCSHHSSQVFNACVTITAPHVPTSSRIIFPPASSLLSLPSSFPLLSLLPPPPLLSSSGRRWFNDVVIHSCSSHCLMVTWPKSAWQHGEQHSPSWDAHAGSGTVMQTHAHKKADTGVLTPIISCSVYYIYLWVFLLLS